MNRSNHPDGPRPGSIDAADAGLDPEERAWLDEVPERVKPPSRLREAVVERLSARGLLRPSRPDRNRFRIAAVIALAFLGGTLLGRMSSLDTSPPEQEATMTPSGTESSGEQFLLLLYEDAGFDTGDRTAAEVVEEYAAWAGSLAERGLLVAGEQLGPEGLVVEPGDPRAGEPRAGEAVAADEAPLRGPGGVLGGYFVVRAGDYEEARALAADSPHLRYGGRIVVRRIVPT